MTPIELANMLLGIVISVGTVISIAALGIRWLVKHYFEEIKKELRPNSGSSMKDQMTRLEEKQATIEKTMGSQHSKLESKIDKMYDILLEHIAKENK